MTFQTPVSILRVVDQGRFRIHGDIRARVHMIVRLRVRDRILNRIYNGRSFIGIFDCILDAIINQSPQPRSSS